jgi:hypothetical protein
MRRAVLLLLMLLPLSAANIRLYLADGGGDLLVSEYEVLDDRVRYYSVERSAWEEIPLSLVDLEKTRRIEQQQDAARQERAAEDSIERAAERQARTELHRVPIEDGIYYLDGDQVVPIQQAELKTETSKTRTLLRVIAPVPLLGKQTVEVEGEKAELVVTQDRPEFYMRLENVNRFGIIRLKEKKDARLVQVIQVEPQTKQMNEEHEEVEVFRQQFAPGVYKIWPTQPIPAGEYAVMEYTPGEGNIRVWDFSCQPAAAGPAAGASESSTVPGKDP